MHQHRTFWPCEDGRIGQLDGGIDVWITLSPVTAAGGGALEVALGSKRAGFAARVRKAIKADGKQTTCALEWLQPDCHEQMEKAGIAYDLNPGDAIFHDWYIFIEVTPLWILQKG